MSPSGKKTKVEVSFTNWVLGGSLVNIRESKEEPKPEKPKPRRKAFLKKKDGTYTTYDLPEDFVMPKGRSRRRTKEKINGEDVVTEDVTFKVDGFVDEKGNKYVDIAGEMTWVGNFNDDKKNDDKKKDDEKKDDEKKDDEKKDDEKKDDEKKDDEREVSEDPKGLKWCKICKVPSKSGTEDVMPEGAVKAHCADCGVDHWMRQSHCAGHDHDNEAETGDVAAVEEKKSDDKEKDGKNNKQGKKDKSKDMEEEKVPEPVVEVVEVVEESKVDDEAPKVEEDGTVVFTAEQDKTILEMKAFGSTWAEIAEAVKCDDKDNVKYRHKELKDAEKKTEQAAPADVPEETKDAANTDTDDFGGFGDFGGDLFGAAPTVPDEAAPARSDAEVLADADALLAASSAGATSTWESNATKVDKPKDSSNNKSDKGGKKYFKKGGKKTEASNTWAEEEPAKDNSPKPADTTWTQEAPAEFDPIKSFDNPLKISAHETFNTVPSPMAHTNNPSFHLGPQFYGHLKPDAVWSKDDCALLEHLLDRYDSEKWLHMQANFYNWTGRMIAADFIEKKFKADYAGVDEKDEK